MVKKRHGPNVLGVNLRKAREARGLTQREVEDATSGAVSNGYLCQIERGDTREPGIVICARLAALYGLSLDQLGAWALERPDD